MSDPQKPSPRSADLEHAPRNTQREAERLLSDAGSPEEAQRAVDSATGRRAQPSPVSDAFARQWNFGSYLEMFEASKPLTSTDEKHWLVTHIGANRWIVWNEEDLIAAYTVDSVSEAQELVGPAAKPADEEPPPTG